MTSPRPASAKILQLIAEGKRGKGHIARNPPLDRRNPPWQLMEKLNLPSVPELILYAVRKGVVS
jgi:hypothetical protein